jgi:hypothetical protein
MPGNSANGMRLNVCTLAELETEIAEKNKNFRSIQKASSLCSLLSARIDIGASYDRI